MNYQKRLESPCLEGYKLSPFSHDFPKIRPVYEPSPQVPHNQSQQRLTSTTATFTSPILSKSFQSPQCSTGQVRDDGGLHEYKGTKADCGYLGVHIKVPDDWKRPSADIFDRTPRVYPPTPYKPQNDPNSDHKKYEPLRPRSKQLLIKSYSSYPEFHFYWHPSSDTFAAFTRFIAWEIYNETGQCESNLTVPDSARAVFREMIRHYKACNNPLKHRTVSSKSATGIHDNELKHIDKSMDNIIHFEEEYKAFKKAFTQGSKDIWLARDSDYQNATETPGTTDSGTMHAESDMLRRASKNGNKTPCDTSANPAKLKIKANSSQRRVTKQIAAEINCLSQLWSGTVPDFHKRFTNMESRVGAMAQALALIAARFGIVVEGLDTPSFSGTAISSSNNSVTYYHKDLSSSPINPQDNDQKSCDSIGSEQEDTYSEENEQASNY